MIDSGAEVNVLDECTFNTLSHVQLHSPTVNLYSYGTSGSKSKLPVMGCFIADVSSKLNQKKCTTEFHVIKGKSGNLLSCNTSEKLGLITFAPCVIPSDGSKSTIRRISLNKENISPCHFS